MLLLDWWHDAPLPDVESVKVCGAAAVIYGEMTIR
jgi:hypothetical protein